MKTELTEAQQLLLTAALDGELQDEQWEEVALLLENNAAFAEAWDTQEASMLALEGLDEVDASVDLWQGVSAQMLQQEEKKASYDWFWLAGVAALFFSAKGLDQFALGLGSLTFRWIALAVAIGVFALLKENPFRLASDEELQIVE